MIEREEFLKRLEALCRESGWIIGGCGCCDSPWMVSKRFVERPGMDENFDTELAKAIKHLGGEGVMDLEGP